MKNFKRTKRMTSLVMCGLMVCGATSFAGCFGGEEEREVDTSKTQLNVAVYNGAAGTAWLDAIGAEFEKRYEGVSLEDGKQGVQVWVEPGKDEFTASNLLTSMPDGEYDVYFTQNTNYFQAIDAGVFMDISDLISEKYDSVDFGNGQNNYSILDKMDRASVDYYGVEKNADTNYYAIGWMSPVHGIIYDVDLFCEKGFYFLSDGSLGGNKDNTAHTLSAGPNGVSGDYDDGLPATWEQMKELMTYMRTEGETTPFTWSGQYTYQRNNLFDAIWAAYEGYDDYMLNYSMNGKTLIDGQEVTITPETGYKIASQEGKLAALTAISDIVSNAKNYSDQAFYTSQSHTGAEREFLLSRYEEEPIAMLVEANYWEVEASEYFKEMEEFDEKWAQKNRRFGMMPIPKFIGTAGVPDQTNAETVINANAYMLAAINSYTKVSKAAKEFFKFAHTNEMLSLATGYMGFSRGFKVKLNDSDWNKLSYFQQQTYELQHDKKTVMVNKSLPGNVNFSYGNTIVQYWDRTISYKAPNAEKATVYSDLFKNFADNYVAGTPLSPTALFSSYAVNNTADSWSLK